MSFECWEGSECYDWCSVTSDVNVTISGGNDPHVIKEPVGYNQTGFIIMESHLTLTPHYILFYLSRSQLLTTDSGLEK